MSEYKESNNHNDFEALKEVYSKASEWINVANRVVWMIISIIWPLAGTCLVLASHPDYKEYKFPLLLFSISLWLTVLYMYRLYGNSTSIARNVMRKIELEWNISPDIQLYTLIGSMSKGRFGSNNFLSVLSVVYYSVWAYILLK